MHSVKKYIFIKKKVMLNLTFRSFSMNAIDEAEEVVLLTGTAAAVIFTKNFQKRIIKRFQNTTEKKEIY
jgi:hypothetical protein